MKRSYLLIAAIISGIAVPQLHAARPATAEEAEMARAVEESLRAAAEEEKNRKEEAAAIAKAIEISKRQKKGAPKAGRGENKEYEQAVRASLAEEKKRISAAAAEEEELKLAIAESLEVEEKKHAAENKEAAAANALGKQKILDRLVELEGVAKQNKPLLTQVQNILRTVRLKPYTLDNLMGTARSVDAINGKTKIQYFDQPTTISVLLSPLAHDIATEISRLQRAQPKSFRDYYRANKAVVDAQVALGELDLSEQNLTDLTDFDEEHVPGLNALHDLYLDNNLLTELPESLYNLVGLQTLGLTGNRITEISESIGNLVALQNLHLGENRIAKLPQNIVKLQALVHICMEENQISELPAGISNWQAIEDLELADNQFTEVPDEIRTLITLKVFFLEGNKIKTVPDWMGELVNLQMFDLANNRLSMLPKSIINLIDLQGLYLSGNLFVSAPEGLNKLPALIFLDLSNNPISLNHEQLRKQLDLPPHVTNFVFKTAPQEQVEQDLLNAIRKGDAEKVRTAYTIILAGKVRIGPDVDDEKIDVMKIRDEAGNNLLQLLMLSLSKKIAGIVSPIRAIIQEPVLIEGMAPVSEKEQKAQIEQLQGQLVNINNTYMNILTTLLACGGDMCAQDMQDILSSRNAEGKTVQELFQSLSAGRTLIDRLYGFGPNNPVYQEIGKLITKKPTMVEQKEEKEKAQAEEKE